MGNIEVVLAGIKIIAILAVIVGIYLILEEQMNVRGLKRKGRLTPGSGEEGTRDITSITGSTLDDQLIEALLMISSCLKAGRNLDQAFELVAVATPAPICLEFRVLVQERRLGVPMVDALTNLSNRVKSRDLQLAVNATIFQQETGGNLEDLYRQIVVTVSERKKIMGKIIAGTAHARISGNLVGAVPLFMAVGMFMWHPGYIAPMLENPWGQIVLILSILSSLLGLLFINRMTTSILPETEDMMTKQNTPRSKDGALSFSQLILAPSGRFVASMHGAMIDKYRDGMNQLLTAAASPKGWTADEFIAIKFISTIVFSLLMIVFFNPLQYGAFGWLLLIFVAPIGFHLPRVYVTQRIRDRQRNIEFELPYTIDLLSLSIEAGLDLTGGIAKIVEKSRPTDIVLEFQMFLNDIKLGKTLEEALAEMAERVQVLSFFAFVSSLIQAQRLGAEIGPTLRAQAEQMRYQRMILAEEKVNQLPVKLLVPLVIFIFPSIFVLVLGPSMLRVMKTLDQTGLSPRPVVLTRPQIVMPLPWTPPAERRAEQPAPFSPMTPTGQVEAPVVNPQPMEIK
ncbi:MAG: type II secretion system F family protein [Candidatus Riflebacteria bacterium]|nr:type II secretion system F family protein [Candidatus Riflebacteria bacterium]MBF0500509.1 type II secretion system F family protein [Candidatus Riflebacteria bacterium]